MAFRFEFFRLVVVLCLVMSAPISTLANSKNTKSAEAALQASVKKETEIGKKIADEIAQNMAFIEDPVYTARVRGIFNRLTPWVSRPLPYNIHIVKENSPNAFCIPGGNIYVTTGLLKMVKSDSELAFVIAHELAHADGKHVIIQMERSQKLTLATLVVALASRGAGAAVMLSNIAAIAVANAYSRDLEQDADLKSISIAEKAGYDLVAGVTVMESLAEDELKQPWIDPGIYLDHPKISERIRYIRDVVEKKGIKIYRKSALKLLIPTVVKDSRGLVLKIDGIEIARAFDSSQSQQIFDEARKNIIRHLQMESSTYNIQVSDGKKSPMGVYVGVHRLLAFPIPGGTESKEQVRNRVLMALNEARKKHPMANYQM